MITNWFKLANDMTAVSWEAQRVVSLRMAKFARGGVGAQREAHNMVAEKVAAHMEAAITLAMGGSLESVVRRYRKIVGANERRLSVERRSK